MLNIYETEFMEYGSNITCAPFLPTELMLGPMKTLLNFAQIGQPMPLLVI